MKRKRKLLVVNSGISWGGMGQYSIGLANSISCHADYEVYGLITHSEECQFHTFAKLTKNTTSFAKRHKILKYLLALIHIWKLKPDIILINYNATIHFLLPLLPHTKIVSVLHSDDPDYYRIATINRNYVNAWIAPSPKTRNRLIAYLNNQKLSEKIVTIPHGVSESPAHSRSINEGTFHIIFIGSLYEHKGVDLIPEIFSRLLENHPNTTLTIVGGGPMQQDLNDSFVKHGIEQKVTFTGVIDSASVRNLLKISDVLLFPTRLEGFGLVTIEAMMEGTVPVVTNLEGITDTIVANSDNGFLVEKNNINDFVDCLSRLYIDRSLLKLMSQNAETTARAKFSSGAMASAYLSLFSRI